MNYNTTIRVLLICSLIIVISGCQSDDDSIDNVTGAWSFLGYLVSNNCTQFAFLPLGAEFDLQLQLHQPQGSTTVEGYKTGGLLWAELPLEAGQVAGAYVGGVVTLDWLSTYIFPPFPFMTPEGASSDCLMALNGQAQILTGNNDGTVLNTVSYSSGNCSPGWIQPLPCEMRVDGKWTQVN